jgi:AcrR family transcriptional regulator
MTVDTKTRSAASRKTPTRPEARPHDIAAAPSPKIRRPKTAKPDETTPNAQAASKRERASPEKRLAAAPKVQAAAAPKKGTAAARPKRAAASAPPKRPRREQQRAIDTRLTILKAALSEFAEKGFDAASTRDIGDRAGMQHPLITYHYRTKDILWRAVAEHFISEIRESWDARIPSDSVMSPRERVREEFRALFDLQVKYPDFHQFMLRESRPGSPRLPWLAETILAPMVNRVLPEIRLAQEAGELPEGEPILVHYMMIGMTSVLSSLGAEIAAITGMAVNKPDIAEAYFDMMERVMFRGNFREGKAKMRAGQRKR